MPVVAAKLTPPSQFHTLSVTSQLLTKSPTAQHALEQVERSDSLAGTTPRIFVSQHPSRARDIAGCGKTASKLSCHLEAKVKA